MVDGGLTAGVQWYYRCGHESRSRRIKLARGVLRVPVLPLLSRGWVWLLQAPRSAVSARQVYGLGGGASFTL